MYTFNAQDPINTSFSLDLANVPPFTTTTLQCRPAHTAFKP